LAPERGFADEPTATFTAGPSSTIAPTVGTALPAVDEDLFAMDETATTTASPPTDVATPDITPLPSSTP
jgi:hypothetical protein